MSSPLDGKKVAYVPVSKDLSYPTDAWLFCHYAKSRGIPFDIVTAPCDADVVVLSQMTDLTTWRRVPKGKKLVFIFENPYLAVPQTAIKSRLRGLAKFASRQHRHLEFDYLETLRQMCSRADAVITSTEEQRADILKFCPNVHIILSANSAITDRIKTDYSRRGPFRIVWQGLGGNVRTLAGIRDALQVLREDGPVEIDLVTSERYAVALGRVGSRPTSELAERALGDLAWTIRPWSREALAQYSVGADLAVIPLSLDDPFERGKAPNKLIMFWRMGVPTVTSATPAYCREMNGAGLNLTCESTEDWLNALRRMRDAEEVRRDAGIKGLSYVSTIHSEESLLARWDAVFASLWH